MMSMHLERAMLLIEQHRYELAEKELGRALLEAPDAAMPHALLAICHSQQKKYAAASREAELAIHLQPDEPYVFYAHSIVLDSRNQTKQAKEAIEAAIRLDPYQEQYFAQLASVEISLENWQAALEAAEQGLELDAEDVACNNLRAVALVKLGKTIDAQDTLATTLADSPDVAFSHANMGWSLLEKSEPQKAMEHFREALRLEPEMEWARAGILEAMKARFFLYRIMLTWFLWIAKFQKNARIGILIGGYLGYRILAGIAESYPSWAPYIQPLLVIYIAFAIMTWISSPLFNLVLLTSRFGRLALSKEEVKTSVLVGVCLLGAVALVIASFGTGAQEFLVGALACALVVPPLSAIQSCSAGWPRAAIVLITLALAGTALFITGCVSTGYFLGGETGDAFLASGAVFFFPFIYAALATQFAIAWLVSVTPQPGTNTARWTWVVGSILLSGLTLVLFGLLAVVLLATAIPEPKVFTQPIVAQPIRAEDLQWREETRLAADTQTAESLGFELHGDYRLKGFEESQNRLLWNEQEDVWLEISQVDHLGYLVSLGCAYDGGRCFVFVNRSVAESNTSPRPPWGNPDGFSVRFSEGTDLKTLYEEFLSTRPREGLRSLTGENLLTFLSSYYDEEMAFLLKRGGPTLDEIQKIGGPETSERRAELVRSLWRKQASEKLDVVLADQAASDERTAKLETEKLLFAHDLLDQQGIYDRIRARYPVGRLELVKLTDGQSWEDSRVVVAAIASQLERMKKVAEFDTPLEVDVYYFESR